MDKQALLQETARLIESGNFTKASRLCDRILGVLPNDPDALNLLALVAFREKKFPAAAELYKRAISANPSVPLLWFNLAMVFEGAGQRQQAIFALQKAIGLEPGYADAYTRLGLNLHMLGNLKAAHDSYQQAVSLSPGNHEIHYNLGVLYQALQRPDDAENSYRKSVQLRPNSYEALYQLGCVLQSRRKHAEAAEILQRAKRLQPARIKTYTRLADILLSLGEFDATEQLKAEVVSILEKARKKDGVKDPELYGLIFYLPYLSISGYRDRLLARQYEKSLPPPAFFHSKNEVRNDGKIRLGYLSPHFGNQPISHVTRGLYGLHDRNKFEVIIYSLMDRTNDPGPYLQDIKAGCDRFVDLSGINPAQVARQINSEGIDILVDLTGYMPGYQLPILSQRPAPIQVYWLGHGGGLGLTFIDYVIADATVIPAGEESLYTENVVRLPDIYHSTDTPPIANECPPRSSYGLKEDAFVFCAFNNQIKINREVFDVWMRILERVPNSQLWLSNLQQLEKLSENYRSEASRLGVDPDRLVFASGVLDKSVHFSRHRHADLFLDAFSYNASTTTLDALWGGLPVLTRKGNYFQSRIAASMLKNVGLEDMICQSTQEYEDRAVELANNPEILASLRERLWANRGTMPLFDTKRFVVNLEAAYETMWRQYKTGAPPEGFDVPSSVHPPGG